MTGWGPARHQEWGGGVGLQWSAGGGAFVSHHYDQPGILYDQPGLRYDGNGHITRWDPESGEEWRIIEAGPDWRLP